VLCGLRGRTHGQGRGPNLAGAALGRKLAAMRGPGESYSDVILRLAAVGHESLNGP
jgi:hypothetical protein